MGCGKNSNFVALIVMRTFFVLVKRILQGAIITLVALYALLYVLLSIPAIQRKVRDVGQHTVSQYLGVPLEIARVEISPFNKVELFGVLLPGVMWALSAGNRSEILIEVVDIFAWVFVWEAVDTFFLTRTVQLQQKKRCLSLIYAKICFFPLEKKEKAEET